MRGSTHGELSARAYRKRVPRADGSKIGAAYVMDIKPVLVRREQGPEGGGEPLTYGGDASFPSVSVPSAAALSRTRRRARTVAPLGAG